jgi:hypothetical protein
MTFFAMTFFAITFFVVRALMAVTILVVGATLESFALLMAADFVVIPVLIRDFLVTDIVILPR